VGGCKIGKRPLDAFDHAFMKAGIAISEGEYKEYTIIRKPDAKIILNEPSVTATEAILTYLAFCDADYPIELYHAAIEPHVINHIDFLKHIGADIDIHYDHHFTIRPKASPLKTIESFSDYTSFPII
jgi:UDP-N-acetylglucosamine enolpyruvyl transferase